jgi:hypothetical protein
MKPKYTYIYVCVFRLILHLQNSLAAERFNVIS